MDSPSLLKYIYIALGLLAVDAAISLALVSSMLRGEPANLFVNQGHTTNGAGGTALIIIGFGGVLALFLENRSETEGQFPIMETSGKSSPVFFVWALFTVLSWLLALTALIYTFVVTAQTANQAIDIGLAQRTSPTKYDDGRNWTPENWYLAVLDLPLVNGDDRDVIARNVRLMRGWRFNIIPLFVLGFVLMDLVVLEVLQLRKSRGYGRAATSDVKV
ncbi:hypothetical protein B0T22DRAFT_531475 [Podospora appendiculata]|uniref:Uncharacterized protein n=1 Tax=Podospora appendiculata TaxID=314037 RepID=A0AAE0WYL6_9PEZI|nr:hypothetical protein B0T22DRAFT_531475 [Podospora appendiculata]